MPPTVVTEALEAPTGDAFYVPPEPLPEGQPGDVIWSRQLPSPAGSRTWLVLYRSTSATGAPVAVSGTIVAPDGDDTDRPIVTWAHGTTGLADGCAPSKQFVAGSAESALAALTVARGEVFASTDYEGLGTPGVHPYLVGTSEAHGVLDIVRAAQQVVDAGVTSRSPVMLWGHSQGGHAAAMAADLSATYAPELDVRGAAVGAPAAELALLMDVAPTTPAFNIDILIAAGFHAAYPDLDLTAILTPLGIEEVGRVSATCGADFQPRPELSSSDLIKPNPAQQPGWAERLRENSPGQQATTVPIFVYHGDADNVVPPIVSELLQQRYCRVGTTSVRVVYPGKNHTDVVTAALGDIQSFLDDRLAGTTPASDC
jgi:pimeloyl-ACP methyl ester carboxylesterase